MNNINNRGGVVGEPKVPYVNLYDALSSSYGNKQSTEKIEKAGYIKDDNLSNHNESVFYNPTSKKLLYSVAGSHNLYDWIVPDVALATGFIKNTNRYKEASDILNKAKDKYKPSETILTGHSLSGTIVQGIASKGNGDKVYALNSGYTVGQKTRTANGNFHNYRVGGDIISLFGDRNDGKMKTLKNNNGYFSNPLDAHNINQIKNRNIFI